MRRGSACRHWGLAVTPCSRRERQEQLMGYRKRGPKPKPLVVQVNARRSPASHHPGSLFAARPCPPGAAFSGFHHAEEPCAQPGRLATPRGPPGPSAELIGRPQPPFPPPRAVGQTFCAHGPVALAGCSQARQQRSCLAPVPRQLIEGCFSSFHCFINPEQCAACKLEWAGAACLRTRHPAMQRPVTRAAGGAGVSPQPSAPAGAPAPPSPAPAHCGPRLCVAASLLRPPLEHPYGAAGSCRGQ